MPTTENTTTARWVPGTVAGRRVHVHTNLRAVITPGIDGGWTLDRDVTQDLDLETYPTLAAAKAAALNPEEGAR